MRNMKLRLISAALATCMMASALPASAFALETADATTGTAVNGQTEAANQLHGGDTISTAGNYTMSDEYSQAITINTTEDVTIEITGDVQLASGRLLNVENVGTLTITNDGHTVEATTLEAEELIYVVNGTVTVNGGTYKNNQETDKDQAKSLFSLQGDKKGTVVPCLNLNEITAEANGKTVYSVYGTVTITGGHYTTAYPDNATIRSNFGTLTLNHPTIIGIKGNPLGVYGITTINGGTYISKSYSMALNAGSSGVDNISKTYVHGGEFVGAGTVVCNRAYMEIDGNSTIRVEGDDEGRKHVGVRTESGGNTIINSATIENAEYGVWNRMANANDKQDTSVTVGNVTFENNEKDIYLEKDKTVTISDKLTGTVTIDWDGDSTASIIADGSTFSEDLKLVSANESSVIAPDENGGYSVQERVEGSFLVDTENATATADLGDGTQTLYYYTQVPADTKVTLTADEDPVGQHFDHWELLKDSEDMTAELLGEFSEEDRKEKTVSFAMPKYDLLAKAVYVSDSVPADTEDDSWDAATIVTGVAVGAGAAVLTYHIGTELYAEQVLGKGVAVPKTRADVALKAWELVGKPAVELNGEPLSEAAQAEKWTVESGLMQNDAEGNFNGAKKMNKLKALRVLDAAKKLNAQ